jgi:hypothetical protein
MPLIGAAFKVVLGGLAEWSLSLSLYGLIGLGLKRGLLKMPEKPSVTLPGTVEKLISSTSPQAAGTAQINLDAPHELYRELRVESTLINASGGKVSLKAGSPVQVTITAEAASTTVEVPRPDVKKRSTS